MNPRPGDASSQLAPHTGHKIEVFAECCQLAKQLGHAHVPDNPIFTFDNFSQLVEKGVFRDSVVFENHRDRIQAACYLLLMVYCGARPAELVRTRFTVEALQWKDVQFFIILKWELGRC